jgi:polyisoprenoid-binding protein YceI
VFAVHLERDNNGVTVFGSTMKEARLMFTTRKAAVALLAAALVTSPAFAQESLRVSDGEVTVVCPLTVGGSFEAKTKALSGEVGQNGTQPGAIAGALKVPLDTLETGIGLRDRHMRERYLEVDKGPQYAVATLENIRLDNLDGKGVFKGTLTLHGLRREVTGTSLVQRSDDGVKVEAQFPVKVSEFQIPDPTYLGVGVRDEVTIRVNLRARPADSAVGTSGRKQ